MPACCAIARAPRPTTWRCAKSCAASGRPPPGPTYFEQVRAFALYLQSQGFGPGDKLVIASDGTPEWFFADLAAQSLGGVTVGIYPTNPWPELQYIVRHCKARFAVCGDQEQTDKVLDAMRHGDGLPELQQVLTCRPGKACAATRSPCLMLLGPMRWPRAVRLARTPAHGRTFDAGIDALRPEQDALIVYTSGTTGMPKGARISHRGILSDAAALGAVHGFRVAACRCCATCRCATWPSG